MAPLVLIWVVKFCVQLTVLLPLMSARCAFACRVCVRVLDNLSVLRLACIIIVDLSVRLLDVRRV